MITVVNSSIINSSKSLDLSQIVSNTLPLTRIDNSPLLKGDRWFNPNLGAEGFWNGTYWLSINSGTVSGANTFVYSGESFSIQSSFMGSGGKFKGIFLQNFNLSYSYKSFNGGITNLTNYWKLVIPFRGVRNQIENGHPYLEIILDLESRTNPLPIADQNTYITIPINQFFHLQDVACLNAYAFKVGNPTIYLEASFNLEVKGVM